MSAAVAYADSALAILQRDFRLAWSYRFRFFSRYLSTLFSLALFYYVSRMVSGGAGFESSDEYYAFAVIGIIILQVLTSVLAMPPMNLRQELVMGSWERTVVSPLGPVAGVLGMMAFPFLQAAVSAVVTLVFAALFFGIDVAWATAPLALPVALLGAVAFLPFGILLVAGVLAFKQASMGASYIITAISLVGGLYFPVALLPDWIEWTSQVQPFTPAADLLRHLILGTDIPSDPWLDVAKLTGFALVLLPLSVAGLRLVLERVRRTGTIVEY
ncbi:MAG: ABC transporter permease [Solirubrobacterales bacterium]|nr:ABC transporter permease [Solirubrobacterales bacterium]